jgi:hypothetical protein
MPDVTKDFSAEIRHGGKDASGDNLPLDFGEPDRDLVKPRRVGGGKMNADVAMTGQKVVDELGFMSREIVSHDVDLASERLGSHKLGKKVDELRAGMALSRLAEDFLRFGYQGPRKGKGCRGGNIQSHEPRLYPEKEAEPDPGGPRRRSKAWMAVFSSTQKTAA